MPRPTPAPAARRPRRGRAAASLLAPTLVAVALAGCSSGGATGPSSPSTTAASASPTSSTPSTPAPSASSTTPTTSSATTPAPANVYAAAGAGMLTGPATTAKPLVYVPNTISDTVSVIDPATFTVVDTFPVGREPQHVVPSHDLRTLWVNDDQSNDLYPIDPQTGRAGPKVAVDDPYNLYFTPDGSAALVMAERLRRIDVRDPQTMALRRSLDVGCGGVNHADFSADGSFFVATCEFSGKVLVIPADASRVAKVIDLVATKTPGATDPAQARMGGPAMSMEPGVDSMPQDARLAPDGRTFLVADMLRNGVWLIDAATQDVRGFVPTGKGAHGIYPSRDGRQVYVSNRDEGSVSVLDAATLQPTAKWEIPGGGSPDMGGVSADGTRLWLSGRYDDEVYVFDTGTGALVARIPVGKGPHGLAVWPQPGTYSLGHTGNMR